VIAHVSGIPVEELVPLAGGTGGLLVVRAWLRMRIRAKMKR
jgi:alpha-beta hydrolase superfamily lysophospholipase